MSLNCEKCGKKFAFLEERTYKTKEGNILKLCINCYDKINNEENKLVTKRFLLKTDEQILGFAPACLLNIGLELCYMLCFTNNCLIGHYLFTPRVGWGLGLLFSQPINESKFKKKKKEFQTFQGTIKELVESNTINFALSYDDICAVELGKLFFNIKLTEEHDSKKLRFDFYISYKNEIKTLFMKYLPTKTIIN